MFTLVAPSVFVPLLFRSRPLTFVVNARPGVSTSLFCWERAWARHQVDQRLVVPVLRQRELVIASDRISVCVSALSVCRSCRSDATVIMSVNAPMSSAASTRLTSLTDTGTPSSGTP